MSAAISVGSLERRNDLRHAQRSIAVDGEAEDSAVLAAGVELSIRADDAGERDARRGSQRHLLKGDVQIPGAAAGAGGEGHRERRHRRAAHVFHVRRDCQLICRVGVEDVEWRQDDGIAAASCVDDRSDVGASEFRWSATFVALTVLASNAPLGR